MAFYRECIFSVNISSGYLEHRTDTRAQYNSLFLSGLSSACQSIVIVSSVSVKELGQSPMGLSHLTVSQGPRPWVQQAAMILTLLFGFFVTYNSTNTIQFQRLTSPQMPHPTEITGRFSNNRNNKCWQCFKMVLFYYLLIFRLIDGKNTTWVKTMTSKDQK